MYWRRTMFSEEDDLVDNTKSFRFLNVSFWVSTSVSWCKRTSTRYDLREATSWSNTITLPGGPRFSATTMIWFLDIFPPTLSAPRSRQFSEGKAWGQLWTSRNRQCPRRLLCLLSLKYFSQHTRFQKSGDIPGYSPVLAGEYSVTDALRRNRSRPKYLRTYK